MHANKIWILFLLCFASTASAQLKWDKKEFEYHATLQDTNSVARFTFQNAGDYPVTIASVTTSCGCTTATLDEKKYAAGEKGEITADFKFGNRVGKQEKTIVVQTDDPKELTVLLKMNVFIPEIMKINPAFVYWQKDEEKKAKTISIKILDDQSVRITKVKPSNEKFIVELKVIEEKKEYAIEITPKDTSTPGWTNLNIETDLPKDSSRTFTAFAQVR